MEEAGVFRSLVDLHGSSPLMNNRRSDTIANADNTRKADIIPLTMNFRIRIFLILVVMGHQIVRYDTIATFNFDDDFAVSQYIGATNTIRAWQQNIHENSFLL